MPPSIEETNRSDDVRRRFAEFMAPPMFFLALVFLATLAMLIVIWVDVPRVAEREGAEAGELSQTISKHNFWLEGNALLLSEYGIGFLALIWPFFVAEFGVQFMLRDRAEPFWRYRYFWLLICACPPLRMCARNPDVDDKIWLPGASWCVVSPTLRRDLERTFSIPMIVIALMILPVLGLEFGFRRQVEDNTWLRVLLHISTGLIWFAFAAEFILMFSVADKKLRYCREHWIDLAIILLPLLSFLRSLRIVRAMRLAKFAKVQQLTKMGRLYRLRGLAMRAFRAILLLELLDRFIRADPEKRLIRLQEQLTEKEEEIQELRALIQEVEQEIRAQKLAAQEAGLQVKDEAAKASEHAGEAFDPAPGVDSAEQVAEEGNR